MQNNNSTRFGRYDVRVVSESSTTEPVTLLDAQSWLTIAEGADASNAARVTSLIKTARRRAESFLHKDIIGKSREIYWAYIDNEDVNLPYTASSITSVEVDGRALTLDQEYEVLGLDNPVLRIFSGQVNKVEVAYTTASMTDDDVRNGILMLVEEMFHQVRTPWKAVLSPFKVYGYYGQR